MTKKCFRPEHCNDLGSLYGRLHLASYEYGLKNTVVQRPHWQESPSLQFEANLPIDQETETSICTQLFHSIQNFTKTAKTYGLVHGDLHDGNFLLSQTPKTKVAKNNPQERIQIFDFDDCEYHWFANDIAVGLYYLMHRFSDPLQPELKTNFALDYLQRVFKHYQKFFDLPSDILEHIPIFLRLRDALLYSLVHKVYSKETMGSDDLAGLERRRQRILNKDPGCNWHKIQSALKV